MVETSGTVNVTFSTQYIDPAQYTYLTFPYTTFPSVTNIIFRYDSGTLTMFVDGTPHSVTVALTGAFSVNRVMVGGRNNVNGVASPSNTITSGKYAEFGVANIPLSDNDCINLNTRLQAEFLGVSGIEDGQQLVYRNPPNAWINDRVKTTELSDVSRTQALDRQSLMWMDAMSHYMPMYMKCSVGELFFGDGTTTYGLTLTNQNQWYEVAPTSTLVSNNSRFDTPNWDISANGRLRWIDSVFTPTFHTAFSTSVSSNNAGDLFQISLGLNGTPISGAIYDIDFVSNNTRLGVAFHKVVNLLQNQYISIFFRCTNGNGRILTFTNVNIVAMSDLMW
jgi:hypothetical protein